MPKDLISPEGLRQDGRKSHEVRQLSIDFGIVSKADGSAYLQLGNTKVIALVFGPHEPTDRSTSGQVTFDLSISSFALPMSKLSKDQSAGRRFGGHSRLLERKSGEICSFLKSTFDPILHESIPTLEKGAQIDVLLEVLQSDGSLTAACVNAASCALIDAGIPMRDFVTACNIGFAPLTSALTNASLSALLVDPNGEEERSFRIPTLACSFLPRTQEVVAFSLVSGRLPFDKMNEALKNSCSGAVQIHKKLDYALMTRIRELVNRRKLPKC